MVTLTHTVLYFPHTLDSSEALLTAVSVRGSANRSHDLLPVIKLFVFWKCFE